MKVFNIPVATKEYLKTKSGKDGIIEKPFKTFTDKMKAEYVEQSRIEIEAIKPVREGAPHLFTVDKEMSILNSIYKDLELLGITPDLFKLYNYKGVELSLRFYLEARGSIENNALMVAIAYIINIVFKKAWLIFNGDFKQLSGLIDYAYFGGLTTGIAAYQKEICAGQSRIEDACEAKIKLKEERIKKTIIEAKKLKEENPKISKNAIAMQIAADIGVSMITVRGYLKKIAL